MHRQKTGGGRPGNPCLSLLGGALSLLLVPVAAADETLFRCTSPDGRIEFSQRPCGPGIQEELRIKDERVGWNAPRAMPKAQPKPRPGDRRKGQKRKSTKAVRRKKARREKDCWKKERQVAKIRWRMRRGYKAGKGVELRRRRREYEAYLRKFCK